jgi:dTDP-4-amino-4,6-dideoxygalactose transaminase
MAFKIPYVDFQQQYSSQREEILDALDKVMASGQYILGEEVQKFEKSFAELCNTKFAIGVANGTDALILSLKALGIGPGDEVITTPNSWISSASCIGLIGATPVFVDVRQDQNMNPHLLEQAISSRTKAIIPVHLTGKCADLDTILEIAQRHQIAVIEDAAQAIGAQYKGRTAGSMGVTGCFSLHPLKNLNGAGDGGIIVTNDDKLAETLHLLRNHGLKSRNEITFWGYNSRLDTMQAAILNCRLPQLSQVTEQRRKFASIYRNELQSLVFCPNDAPECYDVYHLFVIQTSQRDELQDYLKEQGIETSIHYPVPIHLQPCAKSLNYKLGDFPNVEEQSQQILSLPMHNGLSESQIKEVAQTIKTFFHK